MNDEELTNAKETIYEGIWNRGGSAGANKRTHAARSGRRSWIGLSTLVRWIGRSRDRLIDEPTTAGLEDVAAELKRLRRENEILRQEREILKRAATFFAEEGSR